MPTPPPRKRFQIHLSTAIVMMFVAGALIWANSIDRRTDLLLEGTVHWPCAGKGWPFIAYINVACEVKVAAVPNDQGEGPIIYYSSAITDLAISMGLILMTWFLCEWLIRRRAARKAA